MIARSNIPKILKSGDMGVPWLTTGEVAAYFGVSRRMVYVWIDSGRLLGMRLPQSKARRVHPTAIAEFEEREGFNVARGKR